MSYNLKQISDMPVQPASISGDQLLLQDNTGTVRKYVANMNGVFPITVQNALNSQSIDPQNNYPIAATTHGTGGLVAGQCVMQMINDTTTSPPIVSLNVAVGRYSPVSGLVVTAIGENSPGQFVTSGNCLAPVLENATVIAGQAIYRDYATGKLTITPAVGYPSQQVGICTNTSVPSGTEPTIVQMRFAPDEYGTNAATQLQLDTLNQVETIRTHGWQRFTSGINNPIALVAPPLSTQSLKIVGLLITIDVAFTPPAELLIGLLVDDAVDASIAAINTSSAQKFDESSNQMTLGVNFGVPLPLGAGVYIQCPSYISGSVSILPKFTITDETP